jgi:hypothetical protein
VDAPEAVSGAAIPLQTAKEGEPVIDGLGLTVTVTEAVLLQPEAVPVTV